MTSQPPHDSETAATPDALEHDDAAGEGLRRRGGRGWRRRWKLLAGLSIVLAFYVAAVSANFLAPYDASVQSRREPFSPPTPIHFRDAEGRWHARPFVYKQLLADPLARTYGEDASSPHALALFTRGDAYRLFGLFETDRHLFGVARDAGTTTGGADVQR
ncbi:MAG TPA: hypothetical protein VJT82_01785, partial [Pyrinomonadaceae bacterium]|nr:hypothetical protein [Pyrinomonadaceae bacterium]